MERAVHNTKQEHKVDKTLAEQFEKYMKKYPKLYQSLAQLTQGNIFKSSKKPVVVDLGTGPGLLSLELHKAIPSAHIIGLDASIDMLMIAKNNAIKNDCKQCRQVLARAENIPLNSNSVDIVVSRFSLSSWKKPNEGFAEIFRVLKSNGRIILDALNKDYPRWRLLLNKLHMLFNAAGKNVIKYHINYYEKAFSVGQVEQLLINAGFKIIKKEGKKNEWKFLIIARKS